MNKLRLLTVLAFLLAAALVSRADTLSDPATFHIGPGAGTSCAMGCGADPNLVGSGNTVDIYQNSGGAPGLPAPTLLILGIANDPTNRFGATDPITGVTYINSYPGGTVTAGSSAFATAGTFGLKAPATIGTGFFGDMTSSQVYSFLTLAGPTDASNSFTNWSGADLTVNGITASNFGIYVFALSSTVNLGANGLINITFTPGSLPLGTYAVAYGQSSGGTPYVVPFTEAGLTARTTSQVPEPSSLLLSGIGLLGLAIAARIRAFSTA